MRHENERVPTPLSSFHEQLLNVMSIFVFFILDIGMQFCKKLEKDKKTSYFIPPCLRARKGSFHSRCGGKDRDSFHTRALWRECCFKTYFHFWTSSLRGSVYIWKAPEVGIEIFHESMLLSTVVQFVPSLLLSRASVKVTSHRAPCSQDTPVYCFYVLCIISPPHAINCQLIEQIFIYTFERIPVRCLEPF